MNKEELAKVLREPYKNYLRNYNVTPMEFANMLGIKYNTLYTYLKGINRSPLYILIKLSELLELELTSLEDENKVLIEYMGVNALTTTQMSSLLGCAQGTVTQMRNIPYSKYTPYMISLYDKFINLNSLSDNNLISKS